MEVSLTGIQEFIFYKFNPFSDILVLHDEDLRATPIRTAAHIIHFSLPNKLETFMHRYIICCDFNKDRLSRGLVQNEDEVDLNRPFSFIFFDHVDNHMEEYIEIYELLRRAKCEMTSDITEFVTVCHNKFE